jgi:hypothetical protein
MRQQNDSLEYNYTVAICDEYAEFYYHEQVNSNLYLYV